MKLNNTESKKIKFTVNTFADIKNDPGKFQNGFISQKNIKVSNQLSRGELTNERLIQNFKQLPVPTSPAKYQARGLASDENNLRSIVSDNSKSCLPTESDFYQRSFQKFAGIDRKPKNSVFNNVQGLNTRLKSYSPSSK